ncbi:glycerophosphodiester phosphodiesterase family protein [Crateriforma conspicua]|uniref:Putative glycerophosphoryl diester phosphodiesterase 1 n=1 Tax=Crateriforma conspicua TaxID=2527996 RepID=A0A5C6FQS0_9PLAN|nr:glycerophosphodiester phosphodiesterase family protein [Crateriforma conspicua]TWU62836.1 putative glycerophosphoryl diester phosphodiesterase 1 [Crateriforma conspicua]
MIFDTTTLCRPAVTCLRFALPITLAFVNVHPTIAEKPLVIAHRGASADAPENTLPAFELAFEQQADGVEGDFYLTIDGQIVCHHDKDTERTGGKKLVVKDCTLDQLRGLEYGQWKAPEFRGTAIPTFQQVYQSVPEGKRFVIELKVGPEIVAPLKAELDRLHHGQIDLLIIAFQEDTVAKCKELLPQIPVHWLTSFRQGDDGVVRPTAAQIAQTVRETSADGVGMQGKRDVIDDAFIAELRRGGCDDFHVWTIDDPADAQYFARLGASGVTTNVPAVVGPAVR